MDEIPNKYLTDIDHILKEKNTGAITKRINLEILFGNFFGDVPFDIPDDYLKVFHRFDSAIKMLERQINN